MKKRMRILILALCFTLLLSSAVYGATRTKTLTAYYYDIKLVVDGVPVTPRDANGTIVEPFACDGTTYLPVRAIGEALGKTVTWDGNTKTVYVGNAPGEDVYLVDVCPPYSTWGYKSPDYFKMMGKTNYHGFELLQNPNAFAYFTLNGLYDSLEFDFGHVDGTGEGAGKFEIYLDGEYVQTIEGTPDMMVQHITVPLNHALQLKIVASSYYFVAISPYYGFSNAVLH